MVRKSSQAWIRKKWASLDFPMEQIKKKNQVPKIGDTERFGGGFSLT